MIGKRPQFFSKSKQKNDGKDTEMIEQESEAYGASTIAVERKGKESNFTALWEPFEKGKPAGLTIESLAEEPTGVLLRVKGPGWTDLIAIRTGDGADQEDAVGGLKVKDHAWLRVAGGKVVSQGGWGDVKEAAAKVR